LLDVLRDGVGLDRVDVVQPASFAVMVALAAVWQSYGVSPDAVVGHSQGEIAAAVVAGALSLDDGARVVALRSKAIARTLAGRGAMMSIALPLADVESRLGPGLSVAAVNGPSSVVVAGDVSAVDALFDELTAEDVRVRRIAVDYASHSAHVELLRDELLTELDPIEPRAATVPFYSTVTGGWADGAELNAGYWYENLRRRVGFEPAIRALSGAGHGVFVEVSPHPVLTSGIQETAPDAVVAGTLRRDEGTLARFLTSAAELFVRGVPVRWAFPGARRVALPTYAFQRDRYWPDAPAAAPVQGTADADFWAMVDDADPAALASTLDVDGESLTAVLPALASWRDRRRDRSRTDAWRYRTSWKPLSAGRTGLLSGTWLVVLPAGLADDEWVATVVAALGVPTVAVELDGPDRATAAERLSAAGAGFAGVLSLLALDESDLAGLDGVPAGLALTSAMLSALGDAGIGAPVWLLTREAVSACATDAPANPRQSGVWGLGRVAGLEHRGRWGGVLDLPAELDERLAARLTAVLSGTGEDEIALRPSGVFARRLVRDPGGDGEFTAPATVLVAGDAPGLNGRIVRVLADAGTGHVVLAGRDLTEPTDVAARVTVVPCDLTDRDAVERLLADVAPDGVVHTGAAGVPDGEADDDDEDLSARRFARTFRSTVEPAVLLDELTRERDLSMFVLCGSAEAALGNRGQENHAAVDAVLDGIASRRRSFGLSGVSVSWGLLADDATPAGTVMPELTARAGLVAMDPDLAIAVLLRVIRGGRAAVVADVRWDSYAATFGSRAFLRELPEATVVAEPAPSNELAARLRELPAGDRSGAVLELVRAQVAAVLRFPSADAVETGKAFRDLGFDSLTAVELANRLGAKTGLTLPVTLVFDHPSPVVLARFLLAELDGSEQDTEITGGRPLTDDPIAVVGMSCRFPGGADSPDALWRLVAEGVDAVGDLPTDRDWDVDPGKRYQGGFVHDATEFDAGFFGIPPKEAVGMDPQQRLVLEASWEAFEHAGIEPTGLAGSRTGVFVGAGAGGYAPGADAASNLMTGHLTSVISGRVAYHYGLVGPAVTVDTACSSALTAIHLAAQSLHTGDCDLALAGGVTVMVTPASLTEFDAVGGWAGDGRCHAFADSASGMGTGEGVGLVMLERLSDARRNGHRVLAVLAGSAANSDGASNGITAPNGPSQQRVIRHALANAGLSTSDVDAVEAHGTGTTLGDPIEAQALLATYGQDRERPLLLGSVKSNIGHTQAAAGAAGVVKMVLALWHGVLPKTLHVDTPTTAVDWTAGSVELLTERTAWPETGRPRRGAVSSFGVSGTNVHAIFEQAPPAEADPDPASGPESEASQSNTAVPWVLSGRTEVALRSQASRLLSCVDSVAPADVGFTLAGRSVFDHRAVVVGAERSDLTSGVEALSAGDPLAGLVEGVADVDGRSVFVFPGQGAQWVGMGARLLDESPVFAERMSECAAALSSCVDWSLLDVLRDGADLDRVDVVQPVSFAVMVSLAAVWQSHGVRPDAVVGHSQGEIAAAVVAGALSLEDGARVVVLRSQAIARTLAGRGGMMSVALPVAEVECRLGAALSVAAVNGPAAVVVAGDPDALEVLAGELTAEDVRVRRIAVDYASHSAHVDLIRDELLDVLAPIEPREAAVPFYSTVTGEWVDGAALDAGYWFRNLRGQVGFEPAIRALLADRHRVFVEVSPHPVLTMGVQATINDTDTRAVSAGTLRRDDGGLRRFLMSAAELFVRGVPVRWNLTGHHVDLPTYAFQRKRFWSHGGSASGGDPAGLGLSAAAHPLLGASAELADSGGVLCTGRLSLTTHPWLAGHAIGGVVLFPGSGFLELAAQVADQAGCELVEELTLGVPLVLPERAAVVLQVSAGPADDTGRRELAIHSRPADGPEWTRHASGLLAPAGHVTAEEPPGFSPVTWPPPGARAVDVTGLYDQLADAGLAYGPEFRGLRAVWSTGDEVFADVALPADVEDASSYGIHPALLDAALHALAFVDLGGDAGRMLFSLSGVTVHATGAVELRVRLARNGPDSVRLDAAGADATPVLTARSVITRAADPKAVPSPGADPLYHLDWVAGPVGEIALSEVDFVDLDLADPADVPAVAAVRVVSPDGMTVADSVRDLTARVLALLQQWITDERGADSRLLVVTRGAVAAGPADDVPDVAAAAVWGLVRSAQAEHPGRFALLDLDSADLPDVVSFAEPQSVVRGGVTRVARLATLPGDQPADTSPPVADWDPDGTVLITGGTGGLAGQLTRHLVAERGMRHLVLASRRGPESPGALELQAELIAHGADVTVVACDVSDRDAVAALLRGIPAEHPLTAVVHTAAALDDGIVDQLTPERMDTVLGPKALGAWHLHELTEDLAAFVLYSSVSGTVGGAGLGNYAAANAFQDALAQHRAARGLPAQSLVWGPWAADGSTAGGMTAASDQVVARAAASGLRLIPADRGLAMFDLAGRAGRPVVIAAMLDLAALRGAEEIPPVLRGLVRPGARRAKAPAAAGLLRRLRETAEDERERVVVDTVRAQVCAVLGHDPDEVDVRREFREIGFDSLTAVELRNRLSTATGMRLPATMVFDHPTPTALGRYLLERLGELPAAEPVNRTGATHDSDDPIVIVGMGCRYPGGVRSPEDLWRLVADGVDAIGDLPADRGWDVPPGALGQGGFLTDAADFDPGFFGISPREALAMDPQQRLLLETAWETFEHAGIDPTSLRGTRTGVFVGAAGFGYTAPPELGAHLVTGQSMSVVSGRVAYVLGLAGPAVTVDTACSSSLVALQWAAQAVRSGECSLALAGGVCVMATPVAFGDLGLTDGSSPDGRCHAFADSAAGAGWSEGVGLVMVERLSDARRNGHEVLAVVRGSATNSDGASNGLTSPNGPSQQRVIRDALATADLSTSDVDVVEAHGTGTTLGDPIEAQALLATYGQDRETPLLLGSVKSNIGHAQAAAGVAGVIKMVKSLEHGVLPKTLHVDAPSSHVNWDDGAVELLTEPTRWPDTGRARRAAVSSFGVSGTNAHVILEQAPPVESPDREAGKANTVPWVLSGKTDETLRAQAGRLASHVDDLDPVDVGFSLASSRAMFEHRAVLVGAGEELRSGVRALADARPATTVVDGVADVDGRSVFVFPGQGAQWVGMGARLLDESPVFAERLSECAAALSSFVDWSLLDVLRDGVELGRVDVVQPASFAVMVSLAAVWESYGVVPDAVVGHSQGEIAAAVVAGALSLDDGARVVALRSKAIARTLAGRGGMMSVALPLAEVESRLDARLSVAAVNGPASVVVAGDPEVLDALFDELTAEDVRVRRIAVDYASHSDHVELLRDELLAELGPIEPRAATVPFYSTVTGQWEDGTGLDAGYWYRNLRQRVGFAPAIQALLGERHRVFVEVSSHPVLTVAVQEILDDTEVPAVATGTLRRDHGDLARVLLSAAELFVRGVGVRWGLRGRRVGLPTYAFQHKRFWPERTNAGPGDVASVGLAPTRHPLAGAAIALPGSDEFLLTGSVSLRTHPWLADHAVRGTVILPGTAYLELALRAGDEAGLDRVEELTLETPLVLAEDVAVQLQVLVGAADSAGARPLSIHSRRADEPWTRHAGGTLTEAGPPPAAAPADWPPPGADELAVEDFYAGMGDGGLYYGPLFRGLTAAWRSDGAVLAEIRLPEHGDRAGFGIHPALLDAALHPAGAAFEGESAGGVLPFSWNGVTLHATGATTLRVRIDSAGPNAVSLAATDERGEPVVTVESLVSRPVAAQQIGDATHNSLFHLDWTPVTAAPGTGIVVSRCPESGSLPEVLAEVLATLRAWLDDDRADHSRLAVVTSGAVAVGDEPAPRDLNHAAVWGLVRSAQSEHPDRFVLVDVDDPAAEIPGCDEPQYAVRGGTVHAPRLTRAAAPEPGASVFDPEGAVLVTGGSGTLGGLVARHLVTAHGVRHVVLISRSGRTSPFVADLDPRLEADVRAVACDVADRDALAAVLADLPVPLTGVVHTAGELDDGLIETLTPEQLDRTLRAKVDGARALHELTEHLDLSAFVLFSSAATTFGAPGQANYAAANAWLDALAQHRRSNGRPAVAMAWGLWAERSGLTRDLTDGDLARMARGGTAAMPTEHALALFDAALHADSAVLVTARLNGEVLRGHAEAGVLPPLLRGLFRAPDRRPVTVDESAALAALPVPDRTQRLLSLVRGHAAGVLGYESADLVPASRAFKDLGFDSLVAVEFRNRLAAVTGLRLRATLVFDHPTPAALAENLAGRFGDGPQRTGTAAPGALDVEVERLESLVLALDDVDRARVNDRLRALVARTTTPDEPNRVAAAASDEEMFAFIDHQLGS
jgi:acyl transferase domain-containing protein/acyl carrier protein